MILIILVDIKLGNDSVMKSTRKNDGMMWCYMDMQELKKEICILTNWKKFQVWKRLGNIRVCTKSFGKQKSRNTFCLNLSTLPYENHFNDSEYSSPVLIGASSIWEFLISSLFLIQIYVGGYKDLLLWISSKSGYVGVAFLESCFKAASKVSKIKAESLK